jgi:peptidoglycan/xylan/chitin deacetylase (PgdA/CDA1 family)
MPVRDALGALVKAAAAATDQVRRPPRGVTVLLYHQVGAGRDSQVNLSVRQFDEQLGYLASTGDVLTLDAALEALRSGAPSARPAYVLTFDDGTADFAEHVVPALERHRLPATLYLATRWVDEQRSFWDDGTVLTWSALADTLSTGLVTVGSHTHSHALLDRVGPEVIDDELDRSISLINDRLGVDCRHFAYPKALAPSPAADRAVRARFDSAALAGTRSNAFGRTDPYRLARTPIQVSDGMRWFRHKAAGGMWLEDRLRDLANSRRYAGASR